ncbi:Zn-dependent alcohol dehydrogenase [Halomicrobium salinisoli]|uniref:Zn-dependent alcohol dehydrogenase n=1 Tax=Halomicrobium salinisoli TaxID=2878391 RepID=UPI001CEFB80E|nr:Zn-dependent alcohol dehydrogenase [Halomicrobium salinisoli]
MTRTVDAAVIPDHDADGFEVESVELEEPRSKEVRIDVEYAGVCHTDWHAVEGDLPSRHYPTVGGHEGAGVVTEVGEGVDHVDVGDRVVTVWVPGCGRCDQCVRGNQHLCVNGGSNLTRGPQPDGTFRMRQGDADVGQYLLLGTFATETVVSADAVVPVPDELPLDVASIVGCGVATGFGSMAYRADVDPNDTVVVIGAGNVGLNAVRGAVQAGAGRIVASDPLANKREMARQFGATDVVDPTDADPAAVVADLTDGAGADVTVFTVGVGSGELIGEAYQTLGERGELIVTATSPDDHIDVPPLDLYLTEKSIKGCLYGGTSPRRAVSEIVDMYLDGRYDLETLISRTYALSDVNEAYRNLLDGEDVHSVLRC